MFVAPLFDFKRLLKLALCAFITFRLFIGYLYYFQEDYPLPEIDEENSMK